MADGVDVKFTGLPEFGTRLRALGSDMQKKVVRAGATAAGVIFRKAAVANAPVLKKRDTRKVGARTPGQLRKAIFAARSRTRSKPGVEIIIVAARTGGKAAKTGKGAFYWRFVEADHIARGPGQKIKGGTRRAALERKRIKAAGGKVVPGVHFMQRSFTGNQGNAVKSFNARIEARIKKAQRDLNVR